MKKILVTILLANIIIIFGGAIKNSNYDASFIVEAVDCPGGSVQACTDSCISGACAASDYPNECIAGCPDACENLCSGGSSDGGSDDGGSDGGSDGGGTSGGGINVSCDINFCNTSGHQGDDPGETWLGGSGTCYRCQVASNSAGECGDIIDCSQLGSSVGGGGSDGDIDQEEEDDDNNTTNQGDGACVTYNANDPDCDNIVGGDDSNSTSDSLTYLSTLSTSSTSSCSSLCTQKHHAYSETCSEFTFSLKSSTIISNGSEVECRFTYSSGSPDLTVRIPCSSSATSVYNSSPDCPAAGSDSEEDEEVEVHAVSVALEPDQCSQESITNAANNTNGYFTLEDNTSYDNNTVEFVCNPSGENTNAIYRCITGGAHIVVNGNHSCPDEEEEADNSQAIAQCENQFSTQDVCPTLSCSGLDNAGISRSRHISGTNGACDYSYNGVTRSVNFPLFNTDGTCQVAAGYNMTNSTKQSICDEFSSSLSGQDIKQKDLKDLLIPKAHAQSTPDTINPNLLDSGEYVIDPIGYQSAEVDIYEDETRVRYFNDENGNGVRNAGEEFLDTDLITISVTKTKEIRKYNLKTGWNLIGFSFVNADLSKASELVGTLAQQGIITVQVAKFDSGNWIHFVARVKANGEIQTYGTDFNFVPGEGYFIRVKNSGEAILRGNLFTESVPMTLKRGWNLRSIQSVTKYTATSFLQNCNSNNIGCKTISKYVNGLYESVIKDGERYFGENFPIRKSEGYFILNQGARGEFTP